METLSISHRLVYRYPVFTGKIRLTLKIDYIRKYCLAGGFLFITPRDYLKFIARLHVVGHGMK